MRPLHDDETHPEIAPSFTSRIVTVQVLGENNQPRQNIYRFQLMRWVLDELKSQAKKRKRWRELDVVLFPGGFLHLSKAIGHLDGLSRFEVFNKSSLGKKLKTLSPEYNHLSNGISLVVGIDSAAISQDWAGDQMVVSLQNGSYNGLARKAFPVTEDILAGYPQYVVNLNDVESPFRSVTLRNGAKALLLACYEAFAVRALSDKRHYHLAYMKFAFNEQGEPRLLTEAKRNKALNQWLGFLEGEQPNLGLIAIHRFAKAGRDGYWQRHGIAGASSATGGAPFFGAAHFYEAVPSNINTSTLASHQVPIAHLTKGSTRLAHRLQPTDGFSLFDDDGYAIALVRLFTVKHA